MGGAVSHVGNISPVAEANFWNDPDAVRIFDQGLTFLTWIQARIVLHANWPKPITLASLGILFVIFGWDLKKELNVQSLHKTWSKAAPLALRQN